MGFSLSCFYFEAFAFFLEWVCCSMRGGLIHYLDDFFLFIGPSDSDVCSSLLNTFIAVCSDFGVPLAHD